MSLVAASLRKKQATLIHPVFREEKSVSTLNQECKDIRFTLTVAKTIHNHAILTHLFVFANKLKLKMSCEWQKSFKLTEWTKSQKPNCRTATWTEDPTSAPDYSNYIIINCVFYFLISWDCHHWYMVKLLLQTAMEQMRYQCKPQIKK